MSELKRVNRKIIDGDVIRLNSVGLSLATIARVLGCHPTSVTLRLRRLGVEPSDTRRTFMEDVFMNLTLPQQEWLADQLHAGKHVATFVKDLLITEYERNQPEQQTNEQVV
jgi:hypothetical protein